MSTIMCALLAMNPLRLHVLRRYWSHYQTVSNLSLDRSQAFFLAVVHL